MTPLAGIRRFMHSTTEMSSARNPHQPTDFPAVPPSLNAGHYDLRNPPVATHAVPNSAPQETPYLGLQARLSQVWINRWTILLLLILCRTLISVGSLNNDLGSARREALAACAGVEGMASAMASMPHYMSKGVNEIAASGVEKAVNGLMSMLLLSITAVEEIVIFVINLLTSTYLCLITLAVSGSLRAALQVIDDTKDFLDKALGDIGDELSTDIDSFKDDLNEFAKALNSVPKVFGSDDEIPEINIDGPLDKLNNLQLPSGLDDDLDKLNKSIPNFEQVQDFTNDLIRKPFEEVKKLINGSMVAYEFDRSVFPVPQKEKLSFCSDNHGINDFFDKLLETAARAKKIALIVLILLAILVCIPMAYREVWRWRRTQQRAQLLSQNAFDPIDVVHIASRPYTSTVGIKLASRFSSTRRQILVRWFIAYATSTPALFVLALGLAGLFSCLCQFILLKAVEKEAPKLAAEVGEFAGKVVNILNDASEQWAVGTNGVIDSTNNDINKDVFGWVNTTTGAINDTLNGFVDEMSDTLNTTFGGTVLYDPIKEVLNCLIGIKIAGIQKGLTWVSGNARVDFPHLPNDTFSLGAAASLVSDDKGETDSFLSNPGSVATDEITEVVVRLTNKFAEGIRIEAIISTFVVLLWVVIVLIGLIRTLVLFAGRDKTRAEGGPAYVADYNGTSPNMADDGRPYTVEMTNHPGASTAHPAHTGSEKFGYAGMRTDAAIGASHDRKSSHGLLDEKR
ncbi:MAG: plasma membrane fusion protein prm1 [Sclerophora amabilis]|nr:MAG: plasma membrane fusion protein prm1 [Sclerophora amabilis]